MRKIVLAAATCMALCTGAAIAGSPDDQRTPQISGPDQPSSGAESALASRQLIWIYPAFRGSSDNDGGLKYH
jgi:hypothetical protein